MQAAKFVSRQDWIVVRRAHLQREKELTRLRDQVNAERRALPSVKIEKAYMFEGPQGKETLADLFGRNSQLIVYHFMFGPDWPQGCPSCSFVADHIDGADMHLKHHDVSLVVVSRAPWPKIAAFKERMGWRFKWVSSYGTDFNFDYHVSFTPEERAAGKVQYNFGTMDYMFDELPGVSVFAKDTGGDIAHSYSSYARGLDLLLGTHNYLDLTPNGRNEKGTMDWVRHHDRYETKDAAHTCCGATVDTVADPVSVFRSRQQA